jgi:hypothetical protein
MGISGEGEHGGPDSKRPIVVVSGLPRAGTSLMMQMLEAAGLEMASDALRSRDLDNPRGYYELDATRRIREDAAFLDGCVGKAVKVVAPLLPFLPGIFDFRIVFMERDLAQVLASQRAMLERHGEATDVEDAVMARALESQVEKVRAWISGQPNVKCLDVSHRETLEDPSRVARSVLGFLECPALLVGSRPSREAVAAMAAVVEPALWRSRT